MKEQITNKLRTPIVSYTMQVNSIRKYIKFEASSFDNSRGEIFCENINIGLYGKKEE